VRPGPGGGGSRRAGVTRHRRADYRTKPHFDCRSVRARFGRLGSLDLTFTPSPGKVHRCGTIVQAQGIFTGDFEFTGEHRYIHFAVHRLPALGPSTRSSRKCIARCEDSKASSRAFAGNAVAAWK
jgi:hypothetical protein